MNTAELVNRDERTVVVENASYQWAYTILTYSLLIDVMLRAAFRNEAAWDLMAFVIMGGLVCTVFQARRHTLVDGWFKKALLVSLAVAVIAAVIAAIVQSYKG